MGKRKDSSKEYSDQETERRMRDAIRRALNTPPKPHSKMVGKGKRAGGGKRVESKRAVDSV